jgi:hypothetical protein
MILVVPERWTIIEEGVRSYSMPRFPYAVYYRDFPERLGILAFKHHRRHLITGDIAFPGKGLRLYRPH